MGEKDLEKNVQAKGEGEERSVLPLVRAPISVLNGERKLGREKSWQEEGVASS